ncbi:MAG: V-type ATP synthase subunit F [Candidatus Woesearchaeota archaeon]
MIGIIGYQDDVIGFGLTGIEHLQEIPPNADKTIVQEAQQELERRGVQVLIIPSSLREHLQETKTMIIEIPEKNTTTQEAINALTKELLGVQL